MNHLESIKLEDTGLFNYNGGQSTVYNRLKDNQVDNIKDLFSQEISTINIGKALNNNLFIKEEIEGISSLLRWKYLSETTNSFLENLNYVIPGIYIIDYGIIDYKNPGYTFKLIFGYYKNRPQFVVFLELYRALKKCGLDIYLVKALLDDIIINDKKDITLAEYFSKLNPDEIINRLHNNPREQEVFLNIIHIIKSYCQTKETTQAKGR